MNTLPGALLAALLLPALAVAGPAHAAHALDGEPAAISLRALLEAHRRGAPGAEGEALREELRRAYGEAQALSDSGDHDGAERLLQDAYRRLTLAIRDLKEAAGNGPTVETPALVPAAADPGALIRTWTQVDTLLAMLRAGDATDTAEQREPRLRLATDIERRLSAATAPGQPPAELLDRMRAVRDFARAAVAALMAAPPDSLAARPAPSTPAPVQQRAEDDFRRLEASVAELQSAQRRILDTDYPGEQAELRVAAVVEDLRAEAARLHAAGQPQAAQDTLAQAYALVRQSVARLRSGQTLVRRLDFATREEEYDFELQRHAMHLQLADLLVGQKKSDPALGRLADAVLARSAALRLQAEAQAAGGAHDTAVRTLERASEEVYKLFRAAGVYVPD